MLPFTGCEEGQFPPVGVVDGDEATGVEVGPGVEVCTGVGAGELGAGCVVPDAGGCVGVVELPGLGSVMNPIFAFAANFIFLIPHRVISVERAAFSFLSIDKDQRCFVINVAEVSQQTPDRFEGDHSLLSKSDFERFDDAETAIRELGDSKSLAKACRVTASHFDAPESHASPNDTTWSTSRSEASVRTIPSYLLSHCPPERSHEPVTVGLITASSISTSRRVSQPSLSASIQWLNISRSYPTRAPSSTTFNTAKAVFASTGPP